MENMKIAYKMFLEKKGFRKEIVNLAIRENDVIQHLVETYNDEELIAEYKFKTDPNISIAENMFNYLMLAEDIDMGGVTENVAIMMDIHGLEA